MPITKQQRELIKQIFTGTPVVRIEVTFQGGGDSGDINRPGYYDKDGKEIVDEMPKWGMTKDPSDTYTIGKLTMFNHVAFPITCTAEPVRYVFNGTFPMKQQKYTEVRTFNNVDEFIEDLVHGEAMDSGHDWYNNDGGGGSWELDLTTGERSFNMYQYEQREDTVLDTVDKWPGCKLVRKERKRAGTKTA
jgi:hypothetical protein